MDLSKVQAREKLKWRREPYWQRISAGHFLGFRPSKIGKGGSWISRYYDSAKQKDIEHALGDYGDSPANRRHGLALRDAAAWFEHISIGGTPKTVTVRHACETYAKSRSDAAARFKRYVYDEPIANISLHKLNDRQVREWRQMLESRPALITRRREGLPITRQRSQATVNRDLVCLRAALNAALDRGEVATNRAWHSALKPYEGVGGKRNVYLDRSQRRSLLNHLPSDCRAFAHAMCLLPFRPGALAGLRVLDFDHRRRELSIDKDKANGRRRIVVPPQTAQFLRDACEDKPPTAYMFARSDGRPWDKDMWKGPIKTAIHSAALPDAATIYTLRHSTITDLVVGGLDLLTVAQLSGTSVRMIERHYGHLQSERAAEALAGLGL